MSGCPPSAPPCSLLSGRISSLKDETGAVSAGDGVGWGWHMGLGAAACPPPTPALLTPPAPPHRSSSTGTPASSPPSSTSCAPRSWTPGRLQAGGAGGLCWVPPNIDTLLPPLPPRGVDISLLLHEAEFYGIAPLGTAPTPRGGAGTGGIAAGRGAGVKLTLLWAGGGRGCIWGSAPHPPSLLPRPVRRLQLLEDLERSSCGTVLFNGYLPPPGRCTPGGVGGGHSGRVPSCRAAPSPQPLRPQPPRAGGRTGTAWRGRRRRRGRAAPG